jgi:hypothetical protein
MGLLIIFLIILYVALATLLIRVVRKKTSNKLYRRLAVAFVILLPSWDVLLGFISSRKTPGFAGGYLLFIIRPVFSYPRTQYTRQRKRMGFIMRGMPAISCWFCPMDGKSRVLQKLIMRRDLNIWNL